MSQALVPSPVRPVRPSGTPPIDPQKAGENPLQVLHKLLRGRYTITMLLVIVLGPCGAAIGYFGLHKEYTSNAVIRIAPVLPKVLFESEQSNTLPMFDSFLQTQVSLIKSRRVIEMATQSEVWRGSGGDNSIETIAQIPEDLKVEQPKGSQLILVGYTDENPARARAATKAVVDSYMSIFGETNLVTETQRFKLLEDRAKSLSNQIDGITAQILKVANEFGSDDLTAAHDFEVENLQKFQTELEAAKLQLATAKSANNESGTPNTRDYSKLTVEEIAAVDARMQSLYDEQRRLQRKIDELKSTLSRWEERPEYRLAQEQLKSQEQEIDTYARLFRENAARNVGLPVTGMPGTLAAPMTVEQLQNKVQGLQELYDEAKVKTLDLGRKNLQLKDLRTNVTRLQESLNATNARIEQLNLESSVSGRVSVLSEAEMPTAPSNAKRRIQFVILGGLAASALGVGLVVLLGLLKPRIRDIEDAQNILTRLLGALPLLPETLSNPAETLVAAQSVHQIRTKLHLHMPHQEALALTITAPTSGAGKTSFALSLGLSFSSSGTRTLIIDGDMVGLGLTHRTGAAGRCKLGHLLQKMDIISEDESRRALNLARQSGQKMGESLLELDYISEMDLEEGLSIQEGAELGLTDALNGENIEDCLADIGVPNLTILPASRRTNVPIAAMSPGSVRSLLDKLRVLFDVILIDAGPVPGLTDATIMATCSDGVIMVASRGDQDTDVQRALRSLHELNAFVVGFVFNRAKTRDIEQSRYSSTVSSRSDMPQPKVAVEEDRSAELEELLRPVADFGPLPQSVWLSITHPGVFNGEWRENITTKIVDGEIESESDVASDGNADIEERADDPEALNRI